MAESMWDVDVRVMEAISSFEHERPDARTRDRLMEITGLDRDGIMERYGV